MGNALRRALNFRRGKYALLCALHCWALKAIGGFVRAVATDKKIDAGREVGVEVRAAGDAPQCRSECTMSGRWTGARLYCLHCEFPAVARADACPARRKLCCGAT